MTKTVTEMAEDIVDDGDVGDYVFMDNFAGDKNDDQTGQMLT